jgi:YD repeat-containing protein
MYKKIGLASLLLLYGFILSAQSFVCTAKLICPEDTTENNILFKKYYSDQNLLLKEIEYNPYQPNNPTIHIYQYDKDKLISYEDSNLFQKNKKYYSYEKGKIKEVVWIHSSLSTENISPIIPLSPGDSNRTTQPEIIYVWNTDTTVHKYHYNKKGLLIKILIKSKGELIENFETFEYDKQNRLISSFNSNHERYRFFYDSFSRIIRKDKSNNITEDKSDILPYRKGRKQKKAFWNFTLQEELKYDSLGRLIEIQTMKKFPGPKEIFSYDEKGRLKESLIIENSETDVSTLCKTVYLYE